MLMVMHRPICNFVYMLNLMIKLFLSIYFISYSLYFNIKYLVMYIQVSIPEHGKKIILKIKWRPTKNTSNLLNIWGGGGG